MRTRTGQAHLGTTTRRACPAAFDADHRPTRDTAAGALAARTSDDLVAAAQAHFTSPPHEAAAVLGVTDERINDVERTDLADGEAPVLAAIQSVLKRSAEASMVVFTDRPPPQWVVQPCYLLREVAVVANQVRRSHMAGEAT